MNNRFAERLNEYLERECSDHVTREFDCTVKYFWMKVTPVLFSNH